jgi:hypothetical protein
LIKFSGKVLQVMEDDGFVAFRIATKGGYENVVYAIYAVPEGYKRFLRMTRSSSTGVHRHHVL